MGEQAASLRTTIPDQILWAVSRLGLLPETVFVARLAEAGAGHLRRETFPVDRPDADLATVGRPLIARRTVSGTSTVLATDPGLALVEVSRGSASVEVAGSDQQAVDRVVDALAECLGSTTEDPGLVSMEFWAMSGDSAHSARRRIPAPEWSEIARNYDGGTAAATAELLSSSIPGAGRLVLWHGAPGTGKTHVLRALAREWAGWCSTHIITDPEAFLGAGTSYLLDVLTSQGGPHNDPCDAWKLVVLEDAGELLAEDAHTRTGQALSRLLNVTDGVLGQGMNTIVLVSTNEPLGRLHPAIRRAGRCWSEIEFKPLGVEAANDWLDEKAADARVMAPTTLADLYAIARGEHVEPPKLFGFTATA